MNDTVDLHILLARRASEGEARERLPVRPRWRVGLTRHLGTLLCVCTALGCGQPTYQSKAKAVVVSRPPTAEKGDKKPVEIGKNVSLEVLPSGQRRVLVNAVVSFRQGPLEMFMCRRFTKEHESVVAAECDARDIHTALLAAGAVPGAPVKFEPKYEPATGTPIKVFVRYEQDKKEITLDAREWVRDVKTQKPLAIDWVFAGSFFYADPMNAKNQLYAANSGDVICVSNFGTAMLDLPIESSSTNDELQFEAFTDKIPALGTPVTVILEPQTKK